MNSPPLSVSIPRIGKGKSVRARWMAASTGFLTPMQEGQAFRPAGRYIGERQRVQVAALDVVPTMGHQIRFQKAGSGLIPLLECADRDLLLQQRSRSRCGETALTLVCAENAAGDPLSLRSWKAVGFGTPQRCWRCSCRSSASINVGRKGMSRLAQMRLAAFQTRNSACWTSGP